MITDRCWVLMLKGGNMGSAWHPESGEETKPENFRFYHRAPARHRKPSMWHRFAPSRRTIVAPVAGGSRSRLGLGKLAPLARWR